MDKKNVCTPVKGFFEKTAGRLSIATPDSPFLVMPTVSTPPSRCLKIKNPFEPILTERLHTHFMSPTIFTQMNTPKPEDKFKWNIDEISTIKPADIDETAVDQHEQSDHDPVKESFIQEKIDRFFSMKEIVPSPFNKSSKPEPLLPENGLLSPEEKQFKNAYSQTTLTLPPILPKEVEDVLRPYFSFHNSQNEDAKDSSLYKQLFEFNKNDLDDTHSICSSPALSISPRKVQIMKNQDVKDRCNFVSHYDVFENECNLSPIITSSVRRSSSKLLKSAVSLNFSYQSIEDTSMNVVPCYEMTNNTCSMPLDIGADTTNMTDCLSNSNMNWEIEYKNVSIIKTPSSKDSSNDEMDVSNSNTPKSKIFTSQRKKLSDSFLSDDEQESQDTNSLFRKAIHSKASSSKITVNPDLTDAGYQTAATFSDCSTMWSTSNLYASTPTKNKT